MEESKHTTHCETWWWQDHDLSKMDGVKYRVILEENLLEAVKDVSLRFTY